MSEVITFERKKGPTCIGLYDTGMGGVTIFEHLSEKFPDARFVCIADSQYFKHGSRDFVAIRKRAVYAIQWLINSGANAIVVACNTVYLAIEGIVDSFRVPIIGPVHPVIKDALRVSTSRRIGVVATDLTAQSKRYTALIHQCDSGAVVFEKGCSDWVYFIEAGAINSDGMIESVKRVVEELKNNEIDTLILGCTHFPLVKRLVIEQWSGPISIVDSATGIEQWLHESNICSSRFGANASELSSCYWVTEQPKAFQRMVRVTMGLELPVRTLRLAGMDSRDSLALA
ncbi:MAG: glutamate racemase [bacterium]|nr:glutamate racemase [bacterium]